MPGLFYRGDDKSCPRRLFFPNFCPLSQIAASNVQKWGVGEKKVELGLDASLNGSGENENDLAAMVLDFMENGSRASDCLEDSDGDSGISDGTKLIETLQALKTHSGSKEDELLRALVKLSLSIRETDLVCLKPIIGCKGTCIRRLLVKKLRLLGFDGALCASKWPNLPKLPGGEYEYIEVLVRDYDGSRKRVIVDVDFQSQFQIARPTHTYMAALSVLPAIFVGTAAKLVPVLQAMADAAKQSLKQNNMPLPPWRTLDYMNAKWVSACERTIVENKSGNGKGSGKPLWKEQVRAKQCVEQLRHLKRCLCGRD